MKTIIAVSALAFAFSIYSGAAKCDSTGDLSGLAKSLSSLRDPCAKQALDTSVAYSTAQYKAGLDAQLATSQAEMDSRVYSVGHGDRETTQYMIDRMQQSDQQDTDHRKQIADKMTADQQKVKSCTTDAEQQGKALYSTFKAHHKHDSKDAESLMTAWLANLEEIDFDHPNGSDATSAAWKTAKAHAELSSL